MSLYPAVFDVDGTIVSIKTMFSFQKYWLDKHKNIKDEIDFKRQITSVINKGANRETINSTYYKWLKGLSVSEVAEFGRAWFDQLMINKTNLFHQPVIECLRNHQKSGEMIIFLSGSFEAVLRPIAEYLSVDTILCTRLEQEKNKYTGNLIMPQTIGNGKAITLSEFFSRSSINSESAYAYADDSSDIAVLSSVGNPVAVIGDPILEKHAIAAKWNILKLS